MTAHAPNSYAMTASALAELEDELARLRRRAREEPPDELRDARSYGGGSNHHALIEEQMVVAARIALLEDMVARATVVTPESSEDGTAAVGSTVVIEDLDAAGSPRRYRLVAGHSIERDVISAASPVGRALIGAHPGAVVSVELPNGKTRSIRVVVIESGA